MAAKLKKILRIAPLAALVLWALAGFDPFFHGPDEPVYFAGVEAVAKNGDMNLAPGLIARGAPMWASPTGNYPDFHNNGALVFWLPAWLAGRAAYAAGCAIAPEWAGAVGSEAFARSALSFMNLLLAAALCLICFLLCLRFAARSTAAAATAALALATPFFHYALFDSGNANVPAALMSAGLLWALLFCEEFSGRDWFCFGIFASLALAVKTELWLYAGLAVAVFAYLGIGRRIAARALPLFGLGFVSLFGLRALNAYLRFGTVHLEEVIYLRSVFAYRDSYNFNGLLSSFRGIIYTSPVLVFCAAGLLVALFGAVRARRESGKRQAEPLSAVLLAGGLVMLKLLAVGRIFSPAGDGLSFRVLLADFPVFVLLAALFFNALSRPLRLAAYGAAALCGAWNFAVYAQHLCGLDWLCGPGDLANASLLRDCVSGAGLYVFALKGLGMKALLFGVISLAAAVLFFSRRFLAVTLGDRHRNLALAVCGCACVYLCATSLNLAFNARNTSALKARGFFDDCRTMQARPFDMTVLEGQQHLSTLMYMHRYLLLRGREEEAMEVKRLRVRTFGPAQMATDGFALPFSRLAERCNENGLARRARALREKSLAYTGDNWEACLFCGDALMLAGRTDEAVRFYEKTLEINRDSSAALTRLAEFYEKTGKYGRAVEYILKDLALNPANITHYKTLAVFCRKLGRNTEAAAALEKALALEPENMALLRELAGLLIADGRTDEALGYVKTFVKAHPDDPAALSMLSGIYRRQADTEKETLALEKIIALRPQNEAALKRLSELYFDAARMDKALACALALDGVQHSCASARMAGKVYFETGDYARAVTFLSRALESEDGAGDIESMENLARAQYALGRSEDALKSYRSLRAAGAAGREVSFRLGQLCFGAGRRAEAIAALEQAGGDENSLRLLADVYRAAGRADKARDCYARVLKAVPDAQDIRGEKAEMEYMLGNYAVAAADYALVSAARPDDRRLSRRRASALSKAGRTDEAAALLEKLLAGAGAQDRETLILDLGQLYLDADDRESALGYFNLALEENPKSAAALKLVAGLHALDGDDRAAADCYKRITEAAPSAENWLMLARYSRACSDFAAALTAYEKAFGSDTDAAVFDDRIDYAEELLRAGRTDEAAAAAEALEGGDGGGVNRTLTRLLVRIYDAQGDGAKKIALLERCLRTRPEDYFLLVSLARALKKDGKAREASVIFARAGKNAGADADLAADYADALILCGDYAKAEELLLAMLDKYPRDKRALVGLITVYERTDRLAERIKMLERYLARFPENYRYTAALAEACEKSGRTRRAAEVWEKAAAMNTSSVEPLWRLGDAYMLSGAYEQARAAYERALEKGVGGRLESLRKLAAVCDKLGDNETRLVVLREIRTMVPPTEKNTVEYVQQLWRTGRTQEALAGCREFVESYGPGRELCLLLARIAGSGGAVDEVAEILERYLSDNPDDYTVVRALIGLYERAGREKDTVRLYLALAQIRPGVVEPLWKVGDIHMAAGQYRQALAVYEQALKVGGDSRLESLRKLAAVWDKLGDRESRLAVIERITELVPPSDDELVDYANDLVKAGRKAEAIKVYESLTEGGMLSRDVCVALARLYESVNNAAGKINILERYLEREPRDMGLLLALASAFEQYGRGKDAIRIYERAAELDRTAAQPLWRLGDMYMLSGSHEHARDAYEHALALEDNGGRLESLRKLAAVYDKLGQGEKRLAMLGRIMDMLEPSAERMLEYGRTLAAMDRLEEACDWFGRARRQNPSDAAVESEYAELCLKLGRYKDAQESFEALFALRPDSEDLCQKIVDLNETLGDKTNAARYLEERFRINPMAPVSLRKHLGDLYVGMGRNADALRTYAAVLERDPNDEYALKRLAWLHEEQGRWTDAAACLERLADSGRGGADVSDRIKVLNEKSTGK